MLITFKVIDDRLHRLNLEAETRSEDEIPKLPKQMPVKRFLGIFNRNLSMQLREKWWPFYKFTNLTSFLLNDFYVPLLATVIILLRLNDYSVMILTQWNHSLKQFFSGQSWPRTRSVREEKTPKRAWKGGRKSKGKEQVRISSF